MNRWQLTKPPPKPTSPRKPRRVSGNIPRCNCGQEAVAKAIVQVGFDVTYTVTLYLCRACLAYEQDSKDVPPPLSITYLTRAPS